MSDVTDVDPDRMRAAELLDEAGLPHNERAWHLIGTIAAALVEERAKARAPFLALAKELDAESRLVLTGADHARECGDRTMHVVNVRHARIARQAASLIRHAAEATE